MAFAILPNAQASRLSLAAFNAPIALTLGVFRCDRGDCDRCFLTIFSRRAVVTVSLTPQTGMRSRPLIRS